MLPCFPEGIQAFTGEMEIVSGPEGRQKIHYKAPPPDNLTSEMNAFLHWLNNTDRSKAAGLTRAALPHFWFVAIHPFDDGNGRIARALTDMALA